ncbi:Magnesium and cobalt efflux protein CorC [compost metagenome]
MEDGMWILLNLCLVLFLVLLNGFFVAAEFALVKVRGSRLTELVSSGNKRAKVAQLVVSKLDGYLSACQLGITLASLGLGWVGEPAISHLIVEPLLTYWQAPESMISPVSFAIAFLTITFLHIVLGELAPKSIAIFKAEATSMLLSRPLIFFYKLTYPAIYVLNGTANMLLRWIGIQPVSEHDVGHTEEEIRILMKESQRNGHIDQHELTLVENIFGFSERVAREVMIPRTMIECLYTELPFEENLDIIMKRRHTRFPVADKDKDHIIGMVLVTDVYNAALTQPKDQIELHTFVRSIPHVPEAMEISQVLRVIQKDKVQMVVVVDEFGGTAGIITLEDILEEIVGDIRSEGEFERREVEVEGSMTSLDGRILIEKVNELFRIDIDDEELDTIGGWIYSQLEDVPAVGLKVTFSDIEFEILEVSQLRINRVLVHAVPWSSMEEEARVAEE